MAVFRYQSHYLTRDVKMRKLHIVCGTCPLQKEENTHSKCLEDKCSTLKNTVHRDMLIDYMVELEEENKKLKKELDNSSNGVGSSD